MKRVGDTSSASASETTIASAATTDLGTSKNRNVVVTGTTAITSFGTAAGREYLIRFAAALTLTYNATSLILPGAANITTAAGDTCLATSDASGNWRVRDYQKTDGTFVNQSPKVSGTVTATGFLVDAQFRFDNSVGAPGITFDVGDFFFYDRANNIWGWAIGGAGRYNITNSAIYPGSDNGQTLGVAAARWSTVYAGTGTINTSDAREKTAVEPLMAAEIAWAAALAREIGSFRFLEAVAEKGDAARQHIGMTVQRAIELGQQQGLDPLRYAFICHDAWDAEAARSAVTQDVLDEDGEPTGEARIAMPAVPERPAGDRYGFRPDELLLFIARGFEARLSELEAKAG